MSLSATQRLTEWLNDAHHITVMTGAGVSAESGVSTFRDHRESLWSRFDPQKLASQEGFMESPKRVWQWYQWRRKQILAAQPNAAHYALAQLAKRFSLSLITQNVDGLHQAAGAENVTELHGNIFRNRCNSIDCDFVSSQVDPDSELICCPKCGELWLRPDVVWFGESLNSTHIDQAHQASQNCDLFISIGTSSQVYPAAGFAAVARQAGAKLIEINPNATALSDSVDWIIAAPAATTLAPFAIS